MQEMMIYSAGSFTARNIAHWLDYGSLLGAWRDHGIVPWEFDVDMGVREEVHVARLLPFRVHVADGCLCRNATAC